MYSKSTSDRFGELNIPGNYSGNAFRLQNTVNTPSSPPIPGFYRQVPRKSGMNSNTGNSGNYTANNSHTSFSARDTELAPKPTLPKGSDIKIESRENENAFAPPDLSMFDISDDYTVSDNTENSTPNDRQHSNEKGRDISSLSPSNSKYLPESDDLLLLGLLILLMQNKGNEDLMMIIAMLLMT